MKKYIIIIFILLGLTSCVNNIQPKESKIITINIDEELKLLSSTPLRDSNSRVVDTPIYVGDNDEVSFKGDIMKKNSPLKIKVGNKKEIKFSGDDYRIKTLELRDGDLIMIRDKNGKLFVNIKVIKDR